MNYRKRRLRRYMETTHVFKIVQTMCLSFDIMDVVLSFDDHSAVEELSGRKFVQKCQIVFDNAVMVFRKYHV